MDFELHVYHLYILQIIYQLNDQFRQLISAMSFSGRGLHSMTYSAHTFKTITIG